MEGKELALSGLGWVGAPCAHPHPQEPFPRSPPGSPVGGNIFQM